MVDKSSKLEQGFVYYIPKFTILMFVISKFESTTYSVYFGPLDFPDYIDTIILKKVSLAFISNIQTNSNYYFYFSFLKIS